MKTHGDEGWESFPGYLNTVVPRFLEFFHQRNTKITVFVVGQDAAMKRNRQVLKSIADAGHEIGNHSFSHEPWLHLYSHEELVSDFQKSEDAIFEATGKRTTGFRGPGFSCSREVLGQLADRGYVYDGSTFPTFLGPVARAYFLFRSKLDKSAKEDRKQLFGKFSQGFRPLKPFVWNIGNKPLLEIPVTTMPIFKVPIHASYIFYLAGYSRWLARFYFWFAMKLCWATGVQPSFLLHPLDFLDANDVPVLDYFPAMKLDRRFKIELLGDCLDMMEKHWNLVPMQVHAEAALAESLHRRDVREVEMVT